MLGYFEGWYFRQQARGRTLALIPSVFISAVGVRTASVQVITDEFAGSAPAGFFTADKKKVFINTGCGNFSPKGIDIDLREGGLDVFGRLDFGPAAVPRYDIMGPFAVIPFMECRHSVVSLRHSVSGSLFVRGEKFCFDGGTGYIEGDRGHSFPSRYLWTQCFFGKSDSLFLSVADVPVFGTRFTGVIGSVLIRGKEHRLATYLGAKAELSGAGRAVAIHQGGLTLTAELLKDRGHSLNAPTTDGMTRLIRENPACLAHYRFEDKKHVIFDFTAESAGFEYEY